MTKNPSITIRPRGDLANRIMALAETSERSPSFLVSKALEMAIDKIENKYSANTIGETKSLEDFFRDRGIDENEVRARITDEDRANTYR